MSESKSSPGFFNVRNEDAQKLLGWVAIGGAGLAVWTLILPWVLATLVGTIKVAALGIIATVLLTMILEPRFRWSIGFLTQRAVGLFASLIVDTDPIGVMKYRLKEARAMHKELTNAIGQLRGVVDKGKGDRDTYQAELDRAEGRLTAAQNKVAKGELVGNAMMATEANIANRRRSSIERITREIDQGEAMIRLLERYSEQSDAFVRDMADNISHTETERNRLKIAFSAFRSAANILNGKTVAAEMFEEALERANMDAAMMIGEMKQFISASRGALEGFELDQEGGVEQALRNIQAKSQGSLVLDYQPGTRLDLSGAGQVPVSVSADIDRFLGSR